MTEHYRSLVFEGQDFPDGGEPPETECQVIFTITQLPAKLRQEVVRAMVDSANRYLHAQDIFPLPQLEHEVVGLDVPCSQTVYGQVNPYSTPRRPPVTGAQAQAEEDAIQVADALTGTARTSVLQSGEPMTLYVDELTGRDDGFGTMVSPFKTQRRARAQLRLLRRPGMIRNLSGSLLAVSGMAPPAEDRRPPAPRAVPAPSSRASTTRPPITINGGPQVRR